ncbi:MAG: glycosyltransferase family 4 protein [Bulleidia sp.]|nr:glycosyltransferase family 4 protein [Bulleidia sp.]
MNELGKHAELLCLFEKQTEEGREASWYDHAFTGFEGVFLNKENESEMLNKAVSEYDGLINADYSNRVCIKASKMFHKAGKPVFMYADGGLVIPRGPLDLVIRWAMNLCDWFLSSGEETDKYLDYYHVPMNQVLHYRFACMSESEIAEAARMSGQKEQYRLSSGYREKVIAITVGQQIPRKGIDILAKADALLKDLDLGIYVIGGKQEENVQKIIEEEHITNMHFIPFLSKEEIAGYYAGADFYVMPTRYDIWGLVINEAMAYGLPVISTDRCVAALQFNDLYQNAMLVPSEDPERLAGVMRKLCNDKDLRTELGRRSLEGIREYSIEHMAEDIATALQKADKV